MFPPKLSERCLGTSGSCFPSQRRFCTPLESRLCLYLYPKKVLLSTSKSSFCRLSFFPTILFQCRIRKRGNLSKKKRRALNDETLGGSTATPVIETAVRSDSDSDSRSDSNSICSPPSSSENQSARAACMLAIASIVDKREARQKSPRCEKKPSCPIREIVDGYRDNVLGWHAQAERRVSCFCFLFLLDQIR